MTDRTQTRAGATTPRSPRPASTCCHWCGSTRNLDASIHVCRDRFGCYKRWRRKVIGQ